MAEESRELINLTDRQVNINGVVLPAYTAPYAQSKTTPVRCERLFLRGRNLLAESCLAIVAKVVTLSLPPTDHNEKLLYYVTPIDADRAWRAGRFDVVCQGDVTVTEHGDSVILSLATNPREAPEYGQK